MDNGEDRGSTAYNGGPALPAFLRHSEFLLVWESKYSTLAMA